MRLVSVGAATLLALAAYVEPVLAQAPTPPPSLAEMFARWKRPAEPFRVIGNIHYVGTEGLASYLVTTPQGHILIDTPLDVSTSLVKDNIAKLGFKLTDIKLMLNTHAHLDHTGGFAELKKDTGAQMISGEADKPLLEGGYYPNNDAPHLRFPPVQVDRTVKDGDVIEFGGTRITAISTPGHSPGCTSWSLNVKEGNATHSVLIFCSGTVALNRLVGKPTHPTIVEDYRRTFAWAKTFSTDVLLAPHPEMFGMMKKRALVADGKPSPFVDKSEFGTYLATLEAAFEAGLAKQQADLAKN